MNCLELFVENWKVKNVWNKEDVEHVKMIWLTNCKCELKSVLDQTVLAFGFGGCDVNFEYQMLKMLCQNWCHISLETALIKRDVVKVK